MEIRLKYASIYDIYNLRDKKQRISFHNLFLLAYRRLLVTPCLLTRIREFIHTQHRSQYHAPTKRGIAMLSVHNSRNHESKQGATNSSHAQTIFVTFKKSFRSFEVPAIPLIWPKSPYKHSVNRSYRSGKESGTASPLWRHQWRSFVFIYHTDDVKCETRLYISRLLINQRWESALSME